MTTASGNGVTILLLATFGLEIVEAGGALALNAARGGGGGAAARPCRPGTRPHGARGWERMKQALAELGGQMAFSGQTFRQTSGEGLEHLVPGSASMDDRALGLAAHVELERAILLSHGIAPRCTSVPP